MSKFKNEAGQDAPVRVGARAVVHRENKHDAGPRLDAADGLEIHAQADIGGETVLAGSGRVLCGMS